MLGSTSPAGPADHFVRVRNVPEPPETSPPSSVRRPRNRRRADDETSGPDDLVSPTAGTRNQRGSRHARAPAHPVISPVRQEAEPAPGPGLLGGMSGFGAPPNMASGGFFSGLAPLPPLANPVPKPAGGITFNFVTGEVKPVDNAPVTPERKGPNSDTERAPSQRVSSTRSTRSRAGRAGSRAGSEAPEQKPADENHRSTKSTTTGPSSYDHPASELESESQGPQSDFAYISPRDDHNQPPRPAQSNRRDKTSSSRNRARQNTVVQSRQISSSVSPEPRNLTSFDDDVTPRGRQQQQQPQLTIETIPVPLAPPSARRMPFRELQPHEVPTAVPNIRQPSSQFYNPVKKERACRPEPKVEQQQQQQQQQQDDEATFAAVNRLYGQTCHLRDNLSSFLATLGLFRQDVLPYDLVRSQAIEAEQVAAAYNASVSNFAKGAMAAHFGRFFAEICGFCSAMQPRLRTLVAGTMDSFSPGGIDASASLDAVEKLAQFFQGKLSAFAEVLEQTLTGGQQLQPQPQQPQRQHQQQIQQQQSQQMMHQPMPGAGGLRHAPSPMVEQRRPEYGEPAPRPMQTSTPRNALRVQAGMRSAGRTHPDHMQPDLLSPTSSVGSYGEDGEGKRRRRSGAGSRRGPSYVHRTRVVVWRMENDEKGPDPSVIPPRVGTGHAIIMPNQRLTWTSDEKTTECAVDVEIAHCGVRRQNLPWQNPAAGEEVQEKDKNVVWLTIKGPNEGLLAPSDADKENSAGATTPGNRKRPRSILGSPQQTTKTETTKQVMYLMRCFDTASAEEFCRILVECGATAEV